MISGAPPLRWLVTNAFGLTNKLGELQHALLNDNVDIAVITETKFSAQTVASETIFPGYSPPIRRDRDAFGGGIAVWVKSGLPVVHLDQIPTDDHEVLWLAVSLSTQQSVVIGALYRPGSCADNDTCLIEYLGPALDVARTHGTHIVLAGDFNVHHETWLCSSKTTVAGEALEELCAEHQLHQHVLQPTRGLNTLDLILSNMPVPIDTTVKAPLGRSDHGVVLADFYLTPDAEQATSRTVWRYNQADWGRLRAFYRTTDWSTIVTDDPEESCRKLSDVISSGMQKFIPAKQLVTRPADPKWWTPECTTALNTKDKAWKAWRHNIFSEAHKACFMRSVEDAILANVRARTSWELRVRRKLSRGGLKDKQWWSVLKSAAGASHGSSIPCLVDDAGHQLRMNAAKANCLGRYFANKCSLGDDDLGPGDLPHVRQPGVTPLSRIHFRLQTVKRLLNQLDVGKASGPDNIPARVLKECSHELASPLTSLFALCFRKGVQPEAWKSARVVPVYKKGSLSNPKNYRPVSLLPIISKVMERIVNCQIVNHLEKHHLLSTKQYGFRSGLGTADLLAVLGHDWSLAAGSGGCAHVLAVDIAGAFDRVSHPGVLHKAATLGIGGSLLQWLRDYLRNRTLSAIVNGQESAQFQIKAGVPQGSILGPTLFLMYVNDAETCLSPSTRMGVYADDTTLYTIIRSRHDSAGSIADMQSSLDRLSSWGEQWRIRFEPTKSQLLHIGHHRNPWPLPDLTFGAHDIPCGDELKLLGVTFDSKLTFRRHLRNVSLRAVARLGFLRRASSFLGREGRLTTYRGFVRPVLEYAPLTWMGAANSHLQSLDRVQRKALAIIGPDALLQSLAARRQVYALTYMYKLMCLQDHPDLSALVPPRQEASLVPRTRSQLRVRHQHQLQAVLLPTAPNFLQRSFPYGVVDEWNRLPQDMFPDPMPQLKSLQSFKTKVHRHLRQKNWLWATDSL